MDGKKKREKGEKERNMERKKEEKEEKSKVKEKRQPSFFVPINLLYNIQMTHFELEE